MRIIIAGGPRCGKTTFAEMLGKKSGFIVRHTDDLIGKFDWSEDSEEVARWFDNTDNWIVEGVATVRALRKWLKTHHRSEKPCELIYWSNTPHVLLTPKQMSMSRGIFTVWNEIREQLLMRDVIIEDMPR